MNRIARLILSALVIFIISTCSPKGQKNLSIKVFPDGSLMVLVPNGSFIMGSNEGEADERPEHTVLLDAYWIDVYEVTNSDYDKCVQAGKCRQKEKYEGFDAPSQPVVGISWFDASDYCAWVEKRLPTEAEWERAARGEDGRIYPWGNNLDCLHANYRECGRSFTITVGSYPQGKSPYQLMDTAGNAAEWVADWYDPNYYAASPPENPKGPENGKYRVVRGGSWVRYAYLMKISNRAGQSPETRNNSTGFRCAKSAP